jgi:nucleotide-binding universal stress UspA family protein
MSMDKVVVGVDGSETALAAAREACRLARQLDAELHLVMAIKRRGQQVVQGGGEDWVLNDFSAAEQKLQDIAGNIGAPMKPSCSVVEGDPAKTIVAEAKRLEASIIVVGNKRTQGVARVLGAIALDVIHHAPCGVYIAKTT